MLPNWWAYESPLKRRLALEEQTRAAALARIVTKLGKGIVDQRSAGDIIGYNEHRLPQ